ncbi:MAG: hypothetical protein J6T80_00420 [Paludibacteraceae bacterium]|nr:hypothetical protein [Paludibacteraceae bacterium]
MKKYLYLSIVALMGAAMLSSCGSKPANAEGENAEAAAEQAEDNSIQACFAQFGIDYEAVKPNVEGKVIEDGKIDNEMTFYSYAQSVVIGKEPFDTETMREYAQRVFDYCKTIAVDGKLYQIPEFANDRNNLQEVNSPEEAWRANGKLATGWYLTSKTYKMTVYVESLTADKTMSVRVGSNGKVED